MNFTYPADTPYFQPKMTGNHCFGCGAWNENGLRIMSYWDGEDSVCVFDPKTHHAAMPPDVMNGGIIAAVIDCHSVCTAIADAYRRVGREIGEGPVLWYATGSSARQLPQAHPRCGPDYRANANHPRRWQEDVHEIKTHVVRGSYDRRRGGARRTGPNGMGGPNRPAKAPSGRRGPDRLAGLPGVPPTINSGCPRCDELYRCMGRCSRCCREAAGGFETRPYERWRRRRWADCQRLS